MSWEPGFAVLAANLLHISCHLVLLTLFSIWLLFMNKNIKMFIFNELEAFKQKIFLLNYK